MQRRAQLHETSERRAARIAELETLLDGERRGSAEKLAAMAAAESKLSNAFKALSAEALKSNNESFPHPRKSNVGTLSRGRERRPRQPRKGDWRTRETAEGFASDQVDAKIIERLDK